MNNERIMAKLEIIQNPRAFGNLIRQIRAEYLMTQKQMGDILGQPRSTISGWEQGYFMPRAATVHALKTLFPKHADEMQRLYNLYKTQ